VTNLAGEIERESLFTKYIYITYTYQLLQWQAASERKTLLPWTQFTAETASY